jgi:hypothetical protein
MSLTRQHFGPRTPTEFKHYGPTLNKSFMCRIYRNIIIQRTFILIPFIVELASKGPIESCIFCRLNKHSGLIFLFYVWKIPTWMSLYLISFLSN